MNTLYARAAYGPTVALALLVICPGLIVATALGLVGATIAGSLGASPADVSWATVWGGAALALGVVLAAALVGSGTTRRLYTGSLGLVIVGAVAAAIAPDLPTLVVAHAVQSVGTGLLLVAAVSTLLTGFHADRLPLSIAVLGVAILSASMAGPVIGGLGAQGDDWRWIFAAAAALSAAALPLVRLLPEAPPSARAGSLDLSALVLAIVGIIALFYGLGELGWHGWDALSVWAPISAGLALLLVALIGDAVAPAALLPVRALARPIALLGAAGAVVAAASVAAMLGVLPLFLEGVRGLGLHDTGLVFWPGAAAALIATVLAAFVVPVRVRPVLPALGLACLALVGWSLMGLANGSGADAIALLAALLGLGAGLAIVPGLLLAMLHVPRALMARQAGLILLFVVVGAALARAAALHWLGTRATVHYLDLAAQAQHQPSGGVGQRSDLL